jgi:hypothetical protein
MLAQNICAVYFLPLSLLMTEIRLAYDIHIALSSDHFALGALLFY